MIGRHTFKERVIKFTLLFSLTILFSVNNLLAEENNSLTEERLFHIARSKNKNLVCYDINHPGGKLDTKNPINIYWLNMEDKPGRTSNLSIIEKKLAYGYKLISQHDDTCEIMLNAYPGKILTIRKENSKYVCFITINNHPAILKSLYVKAKPTNSLSVEYVELQGITADTQQPISERVKNTKE